MKNSNNAHAKIVVCLNGIPEELKKRLNYRINKYDEVRQSDGGIGTTFQYLATSSNQQKADYTKWLSKDFTEIISDILKKIDSDYNEQSNNGYDGVLFGKKIETKVTSCLNMPSKLRSDIETFSHWSGNCFQTQKCQADYFLLITYKVASNGDIEKLAMILLKNESVFKDHYSGLLEKSKKSQDRKKKNNTAQLRITIPSNLIVDKDIFLVNCESVLKKNDKQYKYLRFKFN